MADSPQPRTRQEVYDLLRTTSKDALILEEMVRLGFWSPKPVQKDETARDTQQLKELLAKVNELQLKLARTQNLDKLRREIREQRMLDSREKQQQTRERREQQRKQRIEAQRQRKLREIDFLGDEVSAALHGLTGDEERLRQRGLPVFKDAADMAQQMGLTVPELRFLAFQRKVSRVHHYARFVMPKKSGGERVISAPMPRLKKAQRWLVDHLLTKVRVHDAAHGFRAQRSIVTNATPHQRAAVVVNLDLKDFFPSIDYRRARGVFRSLGYGEAFATVLALLCTEAEVEAVALDGKRYFVAAGKRKLPQGAPTSPAFTNILCSRLDRRLHAIARQAGFTYTRYADDLTFSASPITLVDGGPLTAPDPGKLLRRVRRAIEAEGFQVHPDKTRVLRASRRQEVTGIVVNHHLTVPRETLRNFRALLFQIERDGPAGKRWGEADDVLAAAVGYANFVTMVTPDKGRPLLARARALQARWRPSLATPAAPPPAAPAEAVGSSKAPEATAAPAVPAAPPEPPAPEPPAPKKWWKLF